MDENELSFSYSNKKINGWIICKLKEEYESLEGLSGLEKDPHDESMLNRVCDLVYGVITDELFPPCKNWVFLASGKILISFSK